MEEQGMLHKERNQRKRRSVWTLQTTGLPRLKIKILGQILGGIWPNFRRNLGEFSTF